jgi:hypothetical protein
VIYKMLRKDGSSSRSLLLYRALCDFGIGLRFVLSPIFMHQVCHNNSCSISINDDYYNDNDNDYDYESKCGISAGMLQFFEMASEAWFLCLAYDLAVTITNPFSSSADRVWGYHTFCWVIASIFTVAIVQIDGMAGYWFVDEEVDDVAICWVQQKQSGNGSLNPKTFIFLYIPLCIVYAYAVRVIWGAYGNLKKGISKTFQHRVRVLLLNSINIGIYILYWFVLFVFYFWAYALASRKPEVSLGFWRLLWFFLSSKGFADLLVFIFISDGYDVKHGKSEDEATAVDFNAALRQEVLHYATTGIRECASRVTDQKSKNKLVLIMHQKNTPLKSIFNFKSLVKIVFSGQEVTAQEAHTAEGDSLQVLETETTEIDEEGGRPNHRVSRRFSRQTLSSLNSLNTAGGRGDIEHQDVIEDRGSVSSNGSRKGGIFGDKSKTRSTDGSSSDVDKSLRMGSLTSSHELGNDVSGNVSFDCKVDDDDDDIKGKLENSKSMCLCLFHLLFIVFDTGIILSS